MKERIEIIFQHGWAFDSGAWDGWRGHLSIPDCDVTTKRAERGYFGRPEQRPEFSSQTSRKILIAHSTGLHFVSADALQRADLLVIISSFLSFHSGDNLEQRRSRRTLRLMMDRLDVEPIDVIDDFYSNCYHPLLTRQLLLRRGADMDSLNVPALKEDIAMIDRCQLDTGLGASIRQTLILHGDCDKVVPSRQAVALQKSLPRSFLIMFEGAGHALPFTHVAPCWLSVRNAMRSILPVGSK